MIHRLDMMTCGLSDDLSQSKSFLRRNSKGFGVSFPEEDKLYAYLTEDHDDASTCYTGGTLTPGGESDASGPFTGGAFEECEEKEEEDDDEDDDDDDDDDDNDDEDDEDDDDEPTDGFAQRLPIGLGPSLSGPFVLGPVPDKFKRCR
jgi:hypothetical protein